MSPLRAQFTSRWDNRCRLSHDAAVCWHVLLGGHAAVQAAAATARQRLHEKTRGAGSAASSPERSATSDRDSNET
jgi:hypothetical protein